MRSCLDGCGYVSLFVRHHDSPSSTPRRKAFLSKRFFCVYVGMDIHHNDDNRPWEIWDARRSLRAMRRETLGHICGRSQGGFHKPCIKLCYLSRVKHGTGRSLIWSALKGSRHGQQELPGREIDPCMPRHDALTFCISRSAVERHCKVNWSKYGKLGISHWSSFPRRLSRTT